MNGQLNGFHEAFIEEGTFLFTSESVGEGHPGELTGTRGREERRAVGLGAGVEAVSGGGHSSGRAPPSWRRGFAICGPAPLPLSPLLIRRRAPACGRFQKWRRAGARGSLRSARGGHCFLLFSPVVWKNLKWATPPRVLASGRRERAPRIAAATTCSPHVELGRGGAGGLSPPDPWVWKWGLVSLKVPSLLSMASGL